MGNIRVMGVISTNIIGIIKMRNILIIRFINSRGILFFNTRTIRVTRVINAGTMGVINTRIVDITRVSKMGVIQVIWFISIKTIRITMVVRVTNTWAIRDINARNMGINGVTSMHITSIQTLGIKLSKMMYRVCDVDILTRVKLCCIGKLVVIDVNLRRSS
jgi:hypothetical protein